MNHLIILMAGLLAASMTPEAGARPDSTKESRSGFTVSGAHMGQDYGSLRRMFPQMECKSSCTDRTIVYLDHPGTLWVSIGEGKINQLAFYFNVARDDGVRRDLILRDLTRLYGRPAKDENCSVWDRSHGAIRFCPLGTGAVVHWNDINWQHIASVIPSAAPPTP